MNPFILASVIGAGSGVTKGAMGMANSYFDRKNRLKLQQRSQDWQEHMSSTQYQRQVSSMKAAGLNPALAVGGSSVSSPPMSSMTGSGDINSDIMKKLEGQMFKQMISTGKIPRPN